MGLREFIRSLADYPICEFPIPEDEKVKRMWERLFSSLRLEDELPKLVKQREDELKYDLFMGS